MFEALRQVCRKDGTKRQPPTLEEVRQLNAGPGRAGDTGNGAAEVADGDEVRRLLIFCVIILVPEFRRWWWVTRCCTFLLLSSTMFTFPSEEETSTFTPVSEALSAAY